MNRLTIKDGMLLINNNKLNCVIEAIEVNGEVVWKEETMLLTSGVERTFNGYDVASISLAFIILEPEENTKQRYEALKIINASFKYMEDETAGLWNLEGDIFRALDIKQARYVNFDYETADDSISAVLELREEQPTAARIQEQQADIAEIISEPAVSEPEMSAAEKALLKKVESYYQEEI